jgi:hypothetical protein
MDNFDMILYICMMVVAMVGALLVFHFLGMIIWWWRGRWSRRSENTTTPWFRRVK